MSSSSTSTGRPPLTGAVFDMDGTISVPNLDFKVMYERCGVPMSEDLLRSIAAMPANQATAANAVIDEMEAEGRRTLQLEKGAKELASWLAFHGVPMALVTRNSALTVDHMLPCGTRGPAQVLAGHQPRRRGYPAAGPGRHCGHCGAAGHSRGWAS